MERQRQQRVPRPRQQRGWRRAEAEVTKAAAAAAVSLTVAETKAVAADRERPGPGPLLVGCGRAAVGPARLPPPAAPPPAPPPGKRRGPGPARTLTAAAAAVGGVGGGGGAMGSLASGGDVEPGLPVEVRGSNGAFYKVRRRTGPGHPPPAPAPGLSGRRGRERASGAQSLEPQTALPSQPSRGDLWNFIPILLFWAVLLHLLFPHLRGKEHEDIIVLGLALPPPQTPCTQHLRTFSVSW